jgi:hypothetical protein
VTAEAVLPDLPADVPQRAVDGCGERESHVPSGAAGF